MNTLYDEQLRGKYFSFLFWCGKMVGVGVGATRITNRQIIRTEQNIREKFTYVINLDHPWMMSLFGLKYFHCLVKDQEVPLPLRGVLFHLPWLSLLFQTA